MLIPIILFCIAYRAEFLFRADGTQLTLLLIQFFDSQSLLKCFFSLFSFLLSVTPCRGPVELHLQVSKRSARKAAISDRDFRMRGESCV